MGLGLLLSGAIIGAIDLNAKQIFSVCENFLGSNSGAPCIAATGG
jgi:hypothetical protein